MKNYTIKENPKGFSNQVYAGILDGLLTNRTLLLNILNTHRTTTEPTIEGFTIDECCAEQYIDDLERIDWQSFNNLAYRVATQIYFNSGNATSVFLDYFEVTKRCLMKIQEKISYGMDLDFNDNYKVNLTNALANLNYSILNSFGMFSISNGEIQENVLKYCTTKNLNPDDLYNELYEYYKANRPTLALFDKYPEIAVQMEAFIEPDMFEMLVPYSDLLTRKELLDIVNRKVIVDEDFIYNLEDRYNNTRMGGESDE